MINPFFIGAGISGSIGVAGYIYSLYDSTKTASIKIRSQEGEFEKIIVNPRKKHGLIVLSDPGKNLREELKNSSDLVYRALLERGFDNNNLYVLEGKKKPTNRFNCHSLPSSKKSLKEIFNHLSQDVTAEDSFFMYVLNHGGTTGKILPIGQSTFSLDNGIIKEKEMEEMLSDLHPNYSLTYFNGCYSGGFAQRLGKGRNIAISTSRKDKVTYGWLGNEIEKTLGNYASPFTLFFYSAIRNKMPDETKLSLENISIERAFDYSASIQHAINNSKSGFGKNTPHLFYGRINPDNVRL